MSVKSSTTNYAPLSALQQEFLLLQAEYAYEKEQYRKSSEMVGIDRKVERGSCWFPVTSGRSFTNSVGQLIVEVQRSATAEGDHEFEPGRPLIFFTRDLNGRASLMSFTATVSYVDGNTMYVALPNSGALSQLEAQGEMGVQLFFDETSYNTMFAALAQVMKAKGSRLEELREVLIGGAKPQFRQGYPTRLPWLNHSQEEAVNHILNARDTAVIHGPPGTGKTTTLVEAIYETLHRESQLLVCAQSNTAVDWICEKLADRGVAVLRIGNPVRVNDKMLSYTYERRFESHPDYSELWSLRKAIRQAQSALRKGGSAQRESHRNQINKLKSRATELEISMEQAIFGEARVVASTLIGAGHRLLSYRRFGSLFIDEAAQALGAACWVAIAKAERVIFAGDHCQLPPTVKSPEAVRGGLGYTLMERVATCKPETTSLLRRQYRMHEDIMSFSSEWFYDGRLEADSSVRNRSILQWDTPMVWYDTTAADAGEEVVGTTQSRINKEEGYLLLHLLEQYVERIGRERIVEERIDFGVISPYKAQVHFLRRLMKQSAKLRPYRSLISVNSVDGFQGQERDVILISLVRANDGGNIGFLRDLRRMNVAITRARMKVMILGDASTLTQHPFYQKLYQHIERVGKIEQPIIDEQNNKPNSTQPL